MDGRVDVVLYGPRGLARARYAHPLGIKKVEPSLVKADPCSQVAHVNDVSARTDLHLLLSKQGVDYRVAA